MRTVRIGALWPLPWLVAAFGLLLVLLNFEINGMTVPVLCDSSRTIGAPQSECGYTDIWTGSVLMIGLYLVALATVSIVIGQVIRKALRTGE
jgi:hypothetical protein